MFQINIAEILQKCGNNFLEKTTIKTLYRNLGENSREFCKKFFEISRIRKKCGEKLLKLSESKGIAKKN